MNAPNGLVEINATFGDVLSFVDEAGHLKPEWQTEYLAYAHLPYPMVLAWAETVQVTKVLCHKLLVPAVEEVFGQIVLKGLQGAVTQYGGCFNFRQKRTEKKLSAHSWGIAIDLDPNTNEQGTEGNMNMDVVAIFRTAGFEWGGDWLGKIKDPMHFQFCTGY